MLIRTCLARLREIGGCARQVSLIGHECIQRIPHPPCSCTEVTSANSVAVLEFGLGLIYPQARPRNTDFLERIRTLSERPVFIWKGTVHVYNWYIHHRTIAPEQSSCHD